MSRTKKKISDPERSMEQLMNRAVSLFVEPYDDRYGREKNLPSLRLVAEELGTTILRTRKLLITAEFYSTEMSRAVREMAEAGRTEQDIMEATGLKKASVNSYLPYKHMAFNLDETTVNADRHRVFRKRVKAVEELQRRFDFPDEMEKLWLAIIAFEGYPFMTAGRGSREGIQFKYSVSRRCGAGGRHYSGVNIEGYGNEIWIESGGETRKKSISRSTVELGYRRAREMKVVKGPKALGIPGAGSYLYPVFLRLGVCSAE